MAMSSAERQRRWMEKNRAAFNLRRRNARKKSLGEKEAAVESNRSRTEMARSEIIGERVPRGNGSDENGAFTPHCVSNGGAAKADDNPPPLPFETKKVGEFRMVVLPEEKPVDVTVSDDTRSTKDVVGGIYRNDNGGVISKFAWEKLQKAKAHAKENNFEVDEYSQ